MFDFGRSLHAIARIGHDPGTKRALARISLYGETLVSIHPIGRVRGARPVGSGRPARRDEHVRVDHRGGDAAVPQELLNCSDEATPESRFADAYRAERLREFATEYERPQ